MSELRDGLSRPLMRRVERERVQLTEEALVLHFARSAPVGTLVRRQYHDPGLRRVSGPPRLHPDYGPVVAVEGAEDRGLSCNLVPIWELVIVDAEPATEEPTP